MPKYWLDIMYHQAYIVSMMRNMIKPLLILLSVLIATTGIAGDYAKGVMSPLDYERLSQPIALTGKCKGIKSVEWRSTSGWTKSTSPSKKTI